jgi:hypothetical protein
MPLPVHTNILQLPQLNGAATQFMLARNADWADQIFFGAPGFTAATSMANCSLSATSNTVSVPSTTSLSPGQPIQATPGIPLGAYVGTIVSTGLFQMVDVYGAPLAATATVPNTTLIFLPIALDLTGIFFISSLRIADWSKQILLTAQTADNTMINGGKNGTVTFNVPRAKVATVAAGIYVVDLLAVDSYHTINLFAGGAAAASVVNGIADATLLTTQPVFPPVYPTAPVTFGN